MKMKLKNFYDATQNTSQIHLNGNGIRKKKMRKQRNF